MGTLNSARIERLATGAIRDRIIKKTDCLTPDISEGDKGISWDGQIFLYEPHEDSTKSNFCGRIPVQVKGHEWDGPYPETIKFDAEVADLRNYMLDGGVLYFVVYLSNSGEDHCIYYNTLTPEKLKTVLSECRDTQKKKRIVLERFPEDGDTIIQVVKSAYDACNITQQRTEKQENAHAITLASLSNMIPRISINSVTAKNGSISHFPYEFRNEIASCICQRLTDESVNSYLIDSFQSPKNPSLGAYIKGKLLNKDRNGSTAVYLIKNKYNVPLMIFGLKTGFLFRIQDLKNKNRQSSNHSPSEHTNSSISKDFIRADNIISAIELTDLYVHDWARNYWNSINRPNTSIGTFLFWYYVAPIIFESQQNIGCEYVYLFVEDVSPDKRLINYYNTKLNFYRDGKMSTPISNDNISCEFMYQKISEMREFRAYYFNKLSSREFI